MRIALGIDHLLTSGDLGGRRIGLVCNPASVDGTFRHTLDRLWQAPDVTVAAIFGPQHGFRSDVQDNMVESPHGRHPRFDVPIYSLYSVTREPTVEMLAGLDLLVIDLPDVGTRVYTFIYTMANCLRAAARERLPVVVCDRPNPIGGTQIEGPVLTSGYESFVGQFPIPLRHGMTIGELGRLFNDQFGIGADLTVSPVSGWSRTAYQDETRLPWIMPSPNLPTVESAVAYPGAVLLEGTTLSEGRGTTRPFELVGAPGIDPEALTDALNARSLEGVHFRPVQFEPTFQKHAGRACGGCQVHVTDRQAFRPVLTTVTLLEIVRHAAPGVFGWRNPPYEYERVKLPIDILSGSDRLRTQLDRGESATEIAAGWVAELDGFDTVRTRYLLY